MAPCALPTRLLPFHPCRSSLPACSSASRGRQGRPARLPALAVTANEQHAQDQPAASGLPGLATAPAQRGLPIQNGDGPQLAALPLQAAPGPSSPASASTSAAAVSSQNGARAGPADPASVPAASAPLPGSSRAAPQQSAASASHAAPQDKRGVRVRVRNMHKVFNTKKGSYTAIDGISLDIAPNSLVALLGPSGSGKTTLLRLISGLEMPDSGELLFDDVDATYMEVADRRIGFVFQSYALFKHMTVADNISFGPRMRKLPVDLDARVAELLELVELPGYGSRFPSQLSGGQRQRVALARALAVEPRLLLLDEPFGALDPQVRVALREGLKAIVQRAGVTSILVTHDQEEAFDIADCVVIFNRGRIEQVGEPAQILSNPATPFVMNFVSDVNQLPSNCLFVRRMGFQTTKSRVMCRPTDVAISKRAPGGSRPAAVATVTDKVNVGWQLKYYLSFDDGVKLEMHALREDDERLYGDVEVFDRVYVQVKPLHFMAYEPEEIESRPLV